MNMLMKAEVLENLDWLHDCELHEVRYDPSIPTDRTLVVELECPADLGFPEWEGRTLKLKACGVFLFKYTAWGHTSSIETLDAWDPGVSESTQMELQRQRAIGLAVPKLTFTVSFHSGSYFELVCKDISIEVLA